MDDYITDILRDEFLIRGPFYVSQCSAAEKAIEEIERRDALLELMQEFLRQSGLQIEFETTLDFEERASYYEFFGLGSESRDPFLELEELFGNDDPDDE